jgi:hypothetical protein
MDAVHRVVIRTRNPPNIRICVTEQVGLAVALWDFIQNVLGLNLGRCISYPDGGFSWIFSFLPVNC